MPSGESFTEPAEPFPPRFWWLKRLIALSIVLTVAYALVLWGWTRRAQVLLDAEVAAIRARGEPILLEDFDVAPVPDHLNAALSIAAAATAAAVPAQQDFLNLRHSINRAPDAQGMQELEKLAQASTSARKHIRMARFQPEVNWNLKYTSPVISVLLPALSPQRQLANVLSANAHYEHLLGHDAEAIEIVRDVLRQADAVNQYGPVLVSHLVAVGMANQATENVRVMSYDLPVLSGEDATTQPSGPPSRQQVRQLIAELLDEGAFRKALTRSMYSERLLQYDIATSPASLRATMGFGGTPPFPVLELLRPLRVVDGVSMMRWSGAVVSATTQPSYPAAIVANPDVAANWNQEVLATRMSHIFSRMLTPSLNRAIENHFRAIALRRLAALRLAIRLYQLDHGGRFPPRLEELSPAYIPHIPADPFAADGRAFGYQPDPQPLLYSVGIDGKDANGDTTILPAYAKRASAAMAVPGSPQDDFLWQRNDAIFPLNKPAPPPPTSNPTDSN